MSGAWDWATHAAGSILGTNQAPTAKSYDVNKDAFYDTSGLSTEYQHANDLKNQYLGRQAPQQQTVQLAPAQMANAYTGNANIGLAQTGNAALGTSVNGKAAQIGAMNTLNAPTLGNASQVQAAQLNNQNEQFRQAQLGLTGQLQAAAAGQGPSLAGIQLGQANAAAAASRMSQAASQRGYGQGAATNRQLAYQQGAAQQANAMQAAQTRIQEQQAAQQALNNVLSSSRGQDITTATTQADLNQQAALANQQANNQFTLQNAANQITVGQGNQQALNQATMQQAAYQQAINQANQQYANQFGLSNLEAQNQFGLANMQALNTQGLANQSQANQFGLANLAAQNQVMQQNQNAANQFALQQGTMNQNVNQQNQAAWLQTMGLNDQQVQNMMQEQMNLQLANQQSQQAYEQLMSGVVAGNNQLNTQAYEAAQGNKTQLWGETIHAVSDKRVKTNIDGGDKEAQDFMDHLGAHTFEYKEPNLPGRNDKVNLGIMAQDLEKSKIGKEMVSQGEDGTKMVNYTQMMSALTAATAQINKRLKKLEGKK